MVSNPNPHFSYPPNLGFEAQSSITNCFSHPGMLLEADSTNTQNCLSLFTPHNPCQDRPEIGQIMDFKPLRLPPKQHREMAVIYVDSSGRKRVKGGKHLKQSQSYPMPFLHGRN